MPKHHEKIRYYPNPLMQKFNKLLPNGKLGKNGQLISSQRTSSSNKFSQEEFLLTLYSVS